MEAVASLAQSLRGFLPDAAAFFAVAGCTRGQVRRSSPPVFQRVVRQASFLHRFRNGFPSSYSQRPRGSFSPQTSQMQIFPCVITARI